MREEEEGGSKGNCGGCGSVTKSCLRLICCHMSFKVVAQSPPHLHTCLPLSPHPMMSMQEER